ncbi:MAG: hypothetical protein KAT58_06020 [candidate division Zixibacteria bacterium]|nr:hypothetical protein [candidate division Zixibacteria bacterium]
MKKWSITDINGIEKYPTSPAWMKNKFSDIMFNSTTCRCKVESVNPQTGEYRVVLYGTLDCNEENYGGGTPV